MSDIFEFEDTSRVERLVGTLHLPPTANPGYVLTVQQDRSIAAAAGGGGSSAFQLIRFPFTHATANLNAGVPVYVPTVGDVLYDAWFEFATSFNGTTPKADIGTAGATNGVFAAAAAAVGVDTTPSSAAGNSLTSSPIASALIPALYLSAGVGVAPLLFTTTDPLLLWVSQDGSLGGTAVGGTAGDAALVVMIGRPA